MVPSFLAGKLLEHFGVKRSATRHLPPLGGSSFSCLGKRCPDNQADRHQGTKAGESPAATGTSAQEPK